MADNCIQCQQPVTAKQQGIQCDGCFKWNHRTCNTGISQQEYRAAVRAGAEIVWFCPLCPVAESSRISMTESSADILESEEFNPPLRDSFADQSTIYGPQAQPAIEESSEEAMEWTDGEASISDPRIQDLTADDPPELTYQLVEGGTKRAKTKLADSDGYTYNVQLRRLNCTYWQCTVRPKGNHCKAIVIQRGNEFQQGKMEHNHPPAVGAATAARVLASVKEKAVGDQFKPASAIVNEVLLNELGDEPCPALPKPDHLARAANRVRQSTRPRDPSDLDFDLCHEHIPDGFLKADIKNSGKRRHLIFATDQQLAHLSKAKVWYIDGTLKLVKHPFQQLFTINAFQRTDDHAKQVPLVFVLMSGRKKKDYRKVMKSILEMLPVEPDVRQITIDFEKALWGVLRQLFPEVRIKGCVFHWTQALWRKIQELGLQHQYSNDQGTYLYLRKFMALPFLPEDQIPPMFEQLSLKATTAPLKQFVNYVAETWIRSSIWPPSSWSVFMMATRSNNDIEGWHNGLHRRASGRWNMPFYLLIDLLHQEARLTALRIRLVSEKKLTRIQRKKYRSVQAQVFNLWDDYSSQRENAEQLLRQCAHLNGPKRSR